MGAGAIKKRAATLILATFFICFWFTSFLFASDTAQTARDLLEANKTREAIDLLKEGLKHDPDSTQLAHLLSNAYLADGNQYWAIRVLHQHFQKTNNCESLSRIVWIHIENKELDRAEELLISEQSRCGSKAGLAAARWKLLHSLVDYYKDRPGSARDLLDAARKEKKHFEEDARLLRFLTNKLDPGRIDPFSIRIEMGVGLNTNAVMTSIIDDQNQGTQSESWLYLNEHEVRFVPPVHRLFRPAFEYRGKAKIFFESDARDYSFYEINGRAGFILGDAPPRAGFYYANQDLLLTGGDKYDEGARWFLEAHRAELEFEVRNWLLIYGGGGRRFFRERARTRDEYDLGAAVRFSLPENLNLSTIIAGRYYNADIDAYDLLGESTLVALYYYYFSDGYFRIAGSVSMDDYFGSVDYFENGISRRDTVLKAMPSFWSPSKNGFSLGLTYDYTNRKSNVKVYEYEAHEFLLKLRWKWLVDPWSGKPVYLKNHVPLLYNLGAFGGHEERMQDLLRQEDLSQKGSSCVD